MEKGHEEGAFLAGEGVAAPAPGDCGLYAFLIELIGFLPTTFIFLVLWMWLIESISWRQIAAVSVGATVVLYLIFGYFLEVPLPGGIFS